MDHNSKPAQYLHKIKLTLNKWWSWVKQNKLKSLIIAISCGLILFLLFIFSIYIGVFGKLPTIDELKKIRNPQATTIYTGNNKVLGYFYVENRSNIDSTQINEFVKNALIATEDNRFYIHNGIDYKSLARVLFKTILLQKKSSGGGSTITQQLAKNVFGRKKQFLLSTVVNKVREMFIAKRLEKIYSKDDILLLYLNTVPFGERLYGLEKASKRFFDKSPEKLTLEEASTIIGILKATTYYNPNKNPENSLKRRNVVLSQVLKYGYIDSITYKESIGKELNLKYTLPKAESSFAAHYKDFLRKEFNTWAIQNPKEDGSLWSIDEDGLSIYTTLHSSIQNSAEEGVKKQLDRLQNDFANQWDAVGGKENLIENLISKHPKGKRMLKEGIELDSIKSVFVQKSQRTLWDGNELTEGNYSLLDSMLFQITTLQAGLIAIHSESGKIMAYVGGKDYGFSQYDQVNLPRQVGSTFKPIVYLAALEAGAEPCDFFDNELRVYSNYEDWSPKNADGKYGGSYSLYGALANSVNTVSVQVVFKAGIKKVIELAKSMGITSDLPAVPSIVLGTAEISLQEMVVAYGSIANMGKVVHPYSLLKIVDNSGNELYNAKPSIVRSGIAKEENINTLQKMMGFTNTIGTGARIQNYNIPYNLIGKTGTTQNNADGWYIAATPEIVCGAWVGTMDSRVNFKSTRYGSGSNTALPMVGRVFGDLSRWNTQIISNFNVDTIKYNCPPYSPLTAEATIDSLEQSQIQLKGVPGILQRLFKSLNIKEDN